MAEKKTYKELEERILELENQINGSGIKVVDIRINKEKGRKHLSCL